MGYSLLLDSSQGWKYQFASYQANLVLRQKPLNFVVVDGVVVICNGIDLKKSYSFLTHDLSCLAFRGEPLWMLSAGDRS
jgi:hypothetical protein